MHSSIEGIHNRFIGTSALYTCLYLVYMVCVHCLPLGNDTVNWSCWKILYRTGLAELNSRSHRAGTAVHGPHRVCLKWTNSQRECDCIVSKTDQGVTMGVKTDPPRHYFGTWAGGRLVVQGVEPPPPPTPKQIQPCCGLTQSYYILKPCSGYMVSICPPVCPAVHPRWLAYILSCICDRIEIPKIFPAIWCPAPDECVFGSVTWLLTSLFRLDGHQTGSVVVYNKPALMIVRGSEWKPHRAGATRQRDGVVAIVLPYVA
jgi:hypothetical protein